MTAPGPLHLRITAFDEASPVLRLTRQQVEQFAAGLSSNMTETSRSVAVLGETERRLAEQHHLGRLSATEYGRALTTLKADISELANTTTLTVTEQEKLAGTSRRVETTLVGLSRAEIRSVDAADLLGSSVGTLTQVMQGNIGAATGMLAQFQRFTIGMPLVTMGVGALVALAAGWIAIEQAAKRAEEAELRAHQARASRLGGVRLSGRERAEGFEALARSGREELAGLGPEREVPRGQVVPTGPSGALVVVNQQAIDEARAYNRELERRRTVIQDLVQLADIQAAEARRGLARAGAAGGGGGRGAGGGGIGAVTLGPLQGWRPGDLGVFEGTTAEQLAGLERGIEAGGRPGRAGRSPLETLGAGLDAGMMESIADASSRVTAQVRALADEAQRAGARWDDLAGSLDRTLQSGTLNAITGVLTGSVQGLGGFGAQFGKVMGGVLITAGQSAIGIGTFSELIRKALTNLFGGGGVAAIVGGAGLIILGGMIQRAAGSAAGGIASGFGGSAGAAGGGGSSGRTDGSLAGAGSNARRTVVIEVPADNQVLTPRNRAVLEWFAEIASAVEDANLVIRTATP